MTTRNSPFNQPSLFEPTRRGLRPAPVLRDDPPEAPYQHGSATSAAAARAVEPKRGTQAARCLAIIRGCGMLGATRHELAETLKAPLSAICARVGEKPGGLIPAGLVAEHGHRMGPYGQMVAVLVATEFLNDRTPDVPAAKE